MITLYEGAFAKINLTLDVLDKRPDGYHDLKSVMQTVSVRDDIEIDVEDKNENDSDTEIKDDVTDNEQSSSKMSLIDFIIAVIKSFFEMLLSLFA